MAFKIYEVIWTRDNMFEISRIVIARNDEEAINYTLENDWYHWALKGVVPEPNRSDLKCIYLGPSVRYKKTTDLAFYGLKG